MEDAEITHWLELPAGMGFVPFSELARLIARALHPVSEADEEYDFAYNCARVNLEEELPKAAAARLLEVRDPLTHGLHTFPHGFALESAVVKVSDLRAYLADRGMGVRVMEAGNGPILWTIENAAAAIAAQERWHDKARDTLHLQMMQAARDKALTVRHPHTDLPYQPEVVRGWDERVTPADVNAWLESIRAPYRWLLTAGQSSPEPHCDEEPPDRRARLLDWFEDEEATGGKRGALARVFTREKARRPTADRSNIGKDISRARTERADKRRAGALIGALGKQR